jgi:AcrR family transcriptional regulator
MWSIFTIAALGQRFKQKPYTGSEQTRAKHQAVERPRPEGQQEAIRQASSRKPATRYAKGVARHGEILETAKRLFGERGFRGTALRDIAAECGIAHSTLLHYFPTKQSLLLAVLAERDQRARSESARLDHLDDILDFTRRIATTQGNDPGMIELTTKMMAEATDPAHPAHDFYRERSVQLVDNLTRLLEQAKLRGFLREGVEPKRAAQGFFALRDGAQLQWLLDPTSIDVPELLVWYQRSLFTGVDF